jgi:hypothetical protein
MGTAKQDKDFQPGILPRDPYGHFSSGSPTASDLMSADNQQVTKTSEQLAVRMQILFLMKQMPLRRAIYTLNLYYTPSNTLTACLMQAMDF